MNIKLVINLIPLLLGLALTAPAAELPAHSLAEFGPIATPAQADAALAKAAQEKAGIVIVPTNAPADWTPQNISQEIWRKPPAPAPARPGSTATASSPPPTAAPVSSPSGITWSRKPPMPAIPCT